MYYEYHYTNNSGKTTTKKGTVSEKVVVTAALTATAIAIGCLVALVRRG